MSLSLLNLNSGSAPEPSQDNTISLREYAGGPMAQADMEQNLVNFRGRINALISNLDSLNTTVNGNQTSLQTEVSELSTSLTNQINQINTQLSGSGNIDASTLDVSGAVTTGELTVDKTLKIKSGNSEATFIANDDYEALTINPRSGSEQGSIFLQKSDLEVGGDAQIEGDLIVQGKLQGNLDIQGNITVNGSISASESDWKNGNYTELTGSRKHFSSSGVVWTQDIWSQFPGAKEVFILAHLGEAYLYYWDVYEPSWKIAAAVGDNQGGVKGCTIRCSLGTDNDAQYEDQDGEPDIAAGTIKFYANLAPGDENTADVLWIKVVKWR